MKELIKTCQERGLDLSKYVRQYLKNRPKDPETGIYRGN